VVTRTGQDGGGPAPAPARGRGRQVDDLDRKIIKMLQAETSVILDVVKFSYEWEIA